MMDVGSTIVFVASTGAVDAAGFGLPPPHAEAATAAPSIASEPIDARVRRGAGRTACRVKMAMARRLCRAHERIMTGHRSVRRVRTRCGKFEGRAAELCHRAVIRASDDGRRAPHDPAGTPG